MSKEATANTRSESMRVRLDPQMMRRFEAQAVDRGMAPSTLAAFVLAEYVREQERTIVLTQVMNEDGVVVSKSKR